MLAAFFAVQKDSGLMKDFLQGRLFYKESMYSRLGAYMIAWRAFLENALIGLGYGGFQYYASHVNLASRVTFRGIWAANQAHNMLLSILAENGIVGLLPFAALTIAVVKQIARTWREADSQYSREWATSMAGICVAFLLPWLFATSGYYKAINNLFYLLLGVTSRSGASAHENGRIREVPALAATVRR
jgi:O-antigen ligase